MRRLDIEAIQLRCDICGWTDPKRRKDRGISDEERLALHKWAHHGHEFPAEVFGARIEEDKDGTKTPT